MGIRASAQLHKVRFGNMKTCVEAHWEWLAYSATLLCIVITFFVMVVAGNRLDRAYTFKSSPLALLFHGFDSETQQQLMSSSSAPRGNKDMEHLARNMEVCLQEITKALKFTAASRVSKEQPLNGDQRAPEHGKAVITQRQGLCNAPSHHTYEGMI